MADRFFVPTAPPPGEFTLAGPEAHHLAAVRRIAVGARIVLFCGDGHDYPATVADVAKKTVTLTVEPGVPAGRELPFAVEVAAAFPKGDRGDFLVEKLTELGGTRLTPLVTARTVVVPKENRQENLARGVIEASKQCGRAVLMRLDPPTAWARFLLEPGPPSKLILHPGGRPLSAFAAGAAGGVRFAVGPEGGFTEAEVEAAVGCGWHAVSFGPRILRVETAAVAAAAWAAGQ